MNGWLDALPDPRRQELCVYPGRHLWWQMSLTFLLRDGSPNAFDADRNSGQLPENMRQICDHQWDASRLGERLTVTCSENAKGHASRVAVGEVARIPLFMVRRLMEMRRLDSARLFDRWWLIAIDGTLQDRGRDTQQGQARCLPICLLLDGLYPVQPVFDLCAAYDWKFIATHREGRQPMAWDEAVQTMLMSPSLVSKGHRLGEDGMVEQTLRWTHQVPFGQHEFQVLFSGEISPTSATLWVWVTNFMLTDQNVYAIANHGGRARQGIENVFNVEKNGGFGLEHAFCANATASQNYHLMMQVAHILEQLLVNGLLRRLTRACRKVTDSKLIELLRSNLLHVRIDPSLPVFGQIRFFSSA